MILADSSAWIDYFRVPHSAAALALDRALETNEVVLGDLIMVEVLQGLRTGMEERLVQAAFAPIRTVTLCGPEIAEQAARNYRVLRRAGITIRGTIDVIIATWCIENGARLVHSDRDFDALEGRLGLSVWR